MHRTANARLLPTGPTVPLAGALPHFGYPSQPYRQTTPTEMAGVT